MPQFILTSGYMDWLKKRLWKNGYHLFTDGELSEVSRVAFQISRSKEIMIQNTKYKGNPVSLLYQTKSDYPIVPTDYYYTTIDLEEGLFMRLSDIWSFIRDINGNVVGHYEVVPE